MTLPRWILARDDWGEDATVAASSTLAGTDADWIQNPMPLDAWLPDSTAQIQQLLLLRASARFANTKFLEYETQVPGLSVVMRRNLVSPDTLDETHREYAYAVCAERAIENTGFQTASPWTLAFTIRSNGGAFPQQTFGWGGGAPENGFAILIGSTGTNTDSLWVVDTSSQLLFSFDTHRYSPLNVAMTGGSGHPTIVYIDGVPQLPLLPTISAAANDLLFFDDGGATGPVHLWHRHLTAAELTEVAGLAWLPDALVADAAVSLAMDTKALVTRGTVGGPFTSATAEFVGRTPLYPSVPGKRNRYCFPNTEGETLGKIRHTFEFIRPSTATGQFPLAVSRVMIADAPAFTRRPVAGNSRGALTTEAQAIRGRSGVRVPARSRFLRGIPMTVRSRVPGELGVNVMDLAEACGTSRDVFVCLDPRVGPLQSSRTYRGTFQNASLKEWNGQVEEATFSIEGL